MIVKFYQKSGESKSFIRRIKKFIFLQVKLQNTFEQNCSNSVKGTRISRSVLL